MDASKKEDHIAMYGNVGIERRYCTDCKQFAFVVSGVIQCCDTEVKFKNIAKRKRISPAFWRRNTPPLELKNKILLEQNYCCFWCDRKFGSLVWKRGREIALRLEWDHYIPFVYSQDNRPQNFVASCHVCNRIKHSLTLSSAEELRVHIYNLRIQKGYSDMRPVRKIIRPETPIAKVL